MPVKPWALGPRKSLNIFGGIGDVMDARAGRQQAQQEQQQRLEDRLAAKEMQDLQKRSLEQALADRAKPAPVKANRTYDAKRGKVIDLDAGTATDLGFTPEPEDASPVSWQTVETDRGMMQVNPKTGETRPLGIRPPAKPDPAARPPQAAEFEKKADFMLEGVKTAVATLEGYVPTPRTWINKIPGAGNYGMTPEDQVAQQAAETMHDAYLRLTTGATINKDELARAARQYIAEPGDAPPVLAAKAKRRAQVLHAIERAASSVRRPGDAAQPPRPTGPIAGKTPTYEEWLASKKGGG